MVAMVITFMQKNGKINYFIKNKLNLYIINKMNAKDELEYEVLKKKVRNPMHNKFNVIHKGKTDVSKYDEFLELMQSFLGFYFCTSEYIKKHCILGDDVLIETKVEHYYRFKEFHVVCRDMHDCLYYRYSMLPFVFLEYSEYYMMDEAEDRYSKMVFTYLQKWPLLVTIYCLEKKANHKLFLL
jgi:hypothetical protein